MKKFISLLQVSILVAGILTLMVSCTKSANLPETVIETQHSNHAFGNVYVLDKYGKMTNNNSGVTVILEGNGMKKEITTGANGRYEFMHIPAGSYTFTFIKDGLANSGQPATISGYTNVPATFMGPVSQHILEIDKAAIQNENIELNMNSYPAPASKQPVGYIVFASNSSDVSAGNAPFSKRESSEALHVQTVSLADLQMAGIDTNATIYLAIYPNTPGVSNSLINGVKGYPALNLNAKKLVSINN
jgi:hypothetical protein